MASARVGLASCLAGFLAVVLSGGFGSFAATPQARTEKQGSTKKKKSSQKNSTKTTKASKKQAASRRSTQQQPTPERYKEIQQALADRGYFGGPVDGEWGESSVEALKRFQHDQNLTEDGKIGSVSLIALGLGPQRAAPAPNSDPALPANTQAAPQASSQAGPPDSPPASQRPAP